MIHVGMTVTLEFRLRKQTAGIDARMIELVCENGGVLVRKRGNDSEIRRIAGAQNQRALKTFPLRDLRFEFESGSAGSGDQTRCAGTGSETAGPFNRTFHELGTHGESHVVIGGEIDQTLSVDFALARRNPVHRAERAQTSFGADIVHPRPDHIKNRRAHSVRMSL